jgi:outer membrane protein OmpA-like peptidoglycan-associated protein
VSRRVPRTVTALWVAAALAAVPLSAAAVAPTSGNPAGAAGSAALAPSGAILRVVSLTRTDGVVQVVATLANYGQRSVQPAKLLRTFGSDAPCLAIDLVDPTTGKVGHPIGLQTGDCRASELPGSLPVGQQITFAVDVADPGGAVLDVAPGLAGAVHGVPVAGDPASSTVGVTTLRPRLQAMSTRVKKQAARLRQGAELSVDLETDVLFAVDSAALSPKAARSLDLAAQTLKSQAGRRLGVYGHTDSTASGDYNLSLSQRRADAVQEALASRLGPGWTFDVKGYGETRPLVPELTRSGMPDPTARALNRRVEIRVLG